MKNHYLRLFSFIVLLNFITFGSIAQMLIFVDELQRLPDSDPSATITAQVLPNSGGKILFGQIGNQNVRWVDGKPEKLDFPGRILETNGDFSYVKGVITNNQRYYVFKDGEYQYMDITLASGYSSINVVYFSDDGNLIIGTGRKGAASIAVKIVNGNWQVIGAEPQTTGFFNSGVAAVRGQDGSIIIGYEPTSDGGTRSYIYENGTFQYFSHQSVTYARVASANGKVVAGHASDNVLNEYVPFKWQDGRVTILGHFGEGFGYTFSTSANNEGNIISGYAEVPGPGYRGNMAFIWIEGRGLIKYNDYISSEYGIQLPGERITRADLSEDKKYISGTIGYTDNTQRSFILLLEEADERLVVNSADDRPLNAPSSTDCNTGQTVEINGREVPECTLRAAIQAAINRHAEEEGKTTDITFNIPGEGLKTLTLLSPLPEVTIPLLIDGTAHRSPFGLPLVSLDGSATAGSGLVLKHDEITIKGMAIHGFTEHGIFIEDIKGIELETMIIGTNAERRPDIGNGGDGIHILGDARVKIGGSARGISPLETPDFGTNVAILGNGGRGLYIHNPANNANGRTAEKGYYEANWQDRSLRVSEDQTKIEANNLTFGMLKFEDQQAFVYPDKKEELELLGANGFVLGNASFWEKDSPTVSVIASESVHIVQATFGKKSAVVSSPDDVNSNEQRGANSSIKVRGSRGITIGSYDPADEPVEGVAAGAWFLEIEDSEDVEVHNVIAGAVKNLGSITQNAVAAIRNLEGGISIRNSQQIRLGRKGLPTFIANNGGKIGSPGAGIRISGNLSQVIKIAALQIGALDGGIIGGNEGDGILLEEGVANFEIGGDEEEEAVIVAGNKGFGLVFSKINENTILAEYVGKEVGKVTNVLTEAISKARFEFPVPNQSGGVKVSNTANILFRKLSIGQTEGNGMELTGALTKNVKILQSSIGSVAGALITSSAKIKGPKGDGILISEASEIEIGDNTGQGEVRIWGSLSKGISLLNANDIRILKAKIGAFDFSEFSSEFADAAQKAGNAMGGISITGSKRVNIFDTKISNNGNAPQSEFGGIMARVSEHIRIHGSEIGNRTPKGNLFGNRHHAVVIENAKNIALSANKVAGNIGGVFGFMSNLNMDGNIIEEQKSEGLRLGMGITIKGGLLTAIRNVIKENDGVGIDLSGITGAVIRFNNIVQNATAGLKAGDEGGRTQENDLKIMARENWWGDASGPAGNGSGTGNEVSGNVDFDHWLTSPIGVSVVPESHLIGLHAEDDLELSVAFANHLLATDQLNITVTDSLGWLQGSTTFSVNVSENEKTFRSMSFKPSSSQSVINKVTIRAASESNPELESVAVVYMLAENRIVYLEKDELNGQDRLDLDRGNFRIGDELLINNGAANEEWIVIKDFGSIVLEEPLRYPHAAGEGIILLSSTVTSLGMETRENLQTILEQNYPNPFSTLTSIPFTLPTSEDIRLEVYDQMGRSVSVLIDGTFSEGKHLVTWDSADLASGIYYYKIQGIRFSETKKMILKK
ncbi:MAG: T9SS type A sorting domain-containing protein [Cyclobacteriaceae bacterium]|nr:T9SS type A sorting domain-containing protein [Cyclobacteriaceae bacterium]